MAIVQSVDVELCWEVKGCHKIRINELGTFPGSISGVRFPFQHAMNPIMVTFYGTNKNRFSKELWIESYQVKLVDKFIRKNEIPDLVLNRAHLESCSFQNLTTDEAAIDLNLIDLTNLEVELNTAKIPSFNLNTKYEPFIKSIYLTNKT